MTTVKFQKAGMQIEKKKNKEKNSQPGPTEWTYITRAAQEGRSRYNE